MSHPEQLLLQISKVYALMYQCGKITAEVWISRDKGLYNRYDRRKGILNKTLVLAEIQNNGSQRIKIPSSHSGGGKGWSLGAARERTRDFTVTTTYRTILLKRQTSAETLKGQWRAGAHCDPDYTSLTLNRIQLMFMEPSHSGGVTEPQCNEAALEGLPSPFLSIVATLAGRLL